MLQLDWMPFERKICEANPVHIYLYILTAYKELNAWSSEAVLERTDYLVRLHKTA